MVNQHENKCGIEEVNEKTFILLMRIVSHGALLSFFLKEELD
jgi:hypothetical protein